MTEHTPRPFQTKTYVVTQRVNLPGEGGENVKILAVKLTHAAAQSYVDKNPGSKIERHLADKEPIT